MTVEFNDNEVLANGETYGKLEFDKEQDAWVLWPNDIDDGVSYFDSLTETQEAIRDELA